jgi:hypothetical protein
MLNVGVALLAHMKINELEEELTTKRHKQMQTSKQKFKLLVTN